MTKDAVATMGDFLPEETSGRDAVHVAVFSAVSAVPVHPGQSVSILHHGDRDVEVGIMGDYVAIVDPFLKAIVVTPGNRFWAYLYPRTITSLSHRWGHPAFEDVASTYSPPSAKLVSEQWIGKFADSIPLHYDTIMQGADDWVASKRRGLYGEYLCFGGLLEGEHVPDEFWLHYEVVRGVTVEEDHRGSFFTCSC